MLCPQHVCFSRWSTVMAAAAERLTGAGQTFLNRQRFKYIRYCKHSSQIKHGTERMGSGFFAYIWNSAVDLRGRAWSISSWESYLRHIIAQHVAPLWPKPAAPMPWKSGPLALLSDTNVKESEKRERQYQMVRSLYNICLCSLRALTPHKKSWCTWRHSFERCFALEEQACPRQPQNYRQRFHLSQEPVPQALQSRERTLRKSFPAPQLLLRDHDHIVFIADLHLSHLSRCCSNEVECNHFSASDLRMLPSWCAMVLIRASENNEFNVM